MTSSRTSRLTGFACAGLFAGMPASKPGLTLKGQVQETLLVPTSDGRSAIVTKALGGFSRRLTEKLPAT